MKPLPVLLILAGSFLPLAAHAGWKAVERVDPYAISGTTGIGLYRSIGQNGPKIGKRRTIAYTDFTLAWKRDYRQGKDGSCRLASAQPQLIIIYKLPRPDADLPPQTRRLWDDFIEGIRAHERKHGAMIVAMVKKLQAASVGLMVADDPGCTRIRQALVAPFRAISNERVAKSRAFDREEMRSGGDVHKLVLALVNG